MSETRAPYGEAEPLAQHTPGPWEAHDFDNGEISIVHRVEGGTSEIAVVQLDEYGDQWDDIRRADARLIAAAPELLAALRDILHELDGRTEPLHPLMTQTLAERARAALNHAAPAAQQEGE